ncbi:MAG: PPC domain-containing DNA-binding protein [Candidatus Eisenbacteria bacterium]
MQVQQLPDGAMDFILVMRTGDEVPACWLDFARQQRITSAQVSGIGAFAEVTLGYFDPHAKTYVKTRFAEQLEVLALTGNFSLFEGEPRVHAHVLLGREDGTTLGGHLIEARVRPTLELFVRAFPLALERGVDEATGLPLLSLRP